MEMEQAQAQAVLEVTESTGLRPGILSPMETLAQSISTIAPTTSPHYDDSAGLRTRR